MDPWLIFTTCAFRWGAGLLVMSLAFTFGEWDGVLAVGVAWLVLDEFEFMLYKPIRHYQKVIHGYEEESDSYNRLQPPKGGSKAS